MLFYIIFALLVIWETVYSVSYGVSLIKSGKKSGGIFLLLLPLISLILCFNFIFGIFMI